MDRLRVAVEHDLHFVVRQPVLRGCRVRSSASALSGRDLAAEAGPPGRGFEQSDSRRSRPLFRSERVRAPRGWLLRELGPEHSYWSRSRDDGYEREQALSDYRARDAPVPDGDVQLAESPQPGDSERAHDFYQHRTCWQRGSNHIDFDIGTATPARFKAAVLESLII